MEQIPGITGTHTVSEQVQVFEVLTPEKICSIFTKEYKLPKFVVGHLRPIFSFKESKTEASKLAKGFSYNDAELSAALHLLITRGVHAHNRLRMNQIQTIGFTALLQFICYHCSGMENEYPWNSNVSLYDISLAVFHNFNTAHFMSLLCPSPHFRGRDIEFYIQQQNNQHEI